MTKILGGGRLRACVINTNVHPHLLYVSDVQSCVLLCFCSETVLHWTPISFSSDEESLLMIVNTRRNVDVLPIFRKKIKKKLHDLNSFHYCNHLCQKNYNSPSSLNFESPRSCNRCMRAGNTYFCVMNKLFLNSVKKQS